jgi:hypothetical protein
VPGAGANLVLILKEVNPESKREFGDDPSRPGCGRWCRWGSPPGFRFNELVIPVRSTRHDGGGSKAPRHTSSAFHSMPARSRVRIGWPVLGRLPLHPGGSPGVVLAHQFHPFGGGYCPSRMRMSEVVQASDGQDSESTKTDHDIGHRVILLGRRERVQSD